MRHWLMYIVYTCTYIGGMDDTLIHVHWVYIYMYIGGTDETLVHVHVH